MKNKIIPFTILAVLLLSSSACNFPEKISLENTATLPSVTLPTFTIPTLVPEATTEISTPTLVPLTLDLSIDQNEHRTPTPDAPHITPNYLTETIYYTVQWGDSLGTIAEKFDVTENFIASANNIYNWNWIEVGQALVLPAPDIGDLGPDFKIIPDSVLVYGPRSIDFDCTALAEIYEGYLSEYSEIVDGKLRTGPEIVEYVATLYSVNPRLLLALLEYQSGWVTKGSSEIEHFDYPLGVIDPYRIGLYYQLTWTANTLNNGYYMWKDSLAVGMTTQDSKFIPASSIINAGTFAMQNLFAKLYVHSDWKIVVSKDGFFATFEKLFGFPFAWSFEPLIPIDLVQPPLQLPFESGIDWYFTGGPHNGWGTGSEWAALDFTPPMEYNGCYSSSEWVTAVADGFIIHSDTGAVIQDIDGDGYSQIGWTIVYMHILIDERVEVGQFVKAGDRIGHPSCEGGISIGTHLHIARRYNGEWIDASGAVPFEMDGWISIGTGNHYDGYLKKNGVTLEACVCRDPINTIQK